MVCCHDRGGSYYLDDCLTPPTSPSLPGLIGLVLVSEEEAEWSGGGLLEMKGWIDQGPAFAYPQLPLSIVPGRLGPLIELHTFSSKNN